MKKYAESKGFFDFKAERELYSIVKAWLECSSQRMDHCLLEPEQMESGIRLGVTQAQEGSY